MVDILQRAVRGKGWSAVYVQTGGGVRCWLPGSGAQIAAPPCSLLHQLPHEWSP